MSHIKDLFTTKDLARISCREKIVKTIANSITPLSKDEIISKINTQYDRTTFYRSFKALLTKGIIHKIVIDNTLIKYALNHKSEQQHAHFYCLNCKTVFCLPTVKWEFSNLPNQHKATKAELLIKGYCEHCN